MNGTDQVMAALRQRYAANAYAFFEQVRDAAGFDAGRTADAVAMSLWPSRGLHLHGFEVKSDRRDWIREHKNPAKAESVNRYCDYWWLVVSDRDLVKEGELPETWGLLAPDPKRPAELALVRQAPKLIPAPIDRSFLACLLRRAYEARPAAKEIEAAEKKGIEAGKEARRWETERQARDLQELRRDVQLFEQAAGLSIRDGWEGDRIGRAVRMVLDGKHEYAARELERVEMSLGRILHVIGEERRKLGPEQANAQLEVPS